MREQEPGDKNLADINLPKHNFLDKLKGLGPRIYHIVYRIVNYDLSNRSGPTPGRWGNG